MTPRTGTAAQFAALRNFLVEANYTAPDICERLEIASLSKVVHLRIGGQRSDALDWLIRLFLLEEALPREWIPGEIGELLEALGLMTGAGTVAATVKLYPVGPVYVISDRDLAAQSGADHVFSAISPQTEEFLAMVPASPCPSCLEICAGAGAAALLAARRYAVQAFAYDLSARSCAFAEFSRRLNGIANLTVARGDLYAPAGRQTFDRILAHPPYVPSLQNTQLFRDGGADGEWLTRRIVEGLPNYLHPGGRLYLLALFAEYGDDPIPARLRSWLRDAGRQFDLVVVLRRALDARAFLFDNCAPEDLPSWRQFVEQRRIFQFRYVNVIVQRHRDEASPLTAVREAGDGYTIGDAERSLQRVGSVDDVEWVKSLRPRVPRGLHCASHSRLENGTWIGEQHVLTTDGPFRMHAAIPEWAPDLLARCDGTRTVAELGQIDYLRGLIAMGLLEVT